MFLSLYVDNEKLIEIMVHQVSNIQMSETAHL